MSKEFEIKKGDVLIKGVAILQDKNRTSFMQAADVFGSYKVVGERISLQYVLRHDEGEKPYDEPGCYYVIGMSSAKQEFGDKLIFSYITGIEVDGKFTPNRIIPPFNNKEVSCISDGKNFFLLVDWLKSSFPELKLTEGEVRRINKITF